MSDQLSDQEREAMVVALRDAGWDGGDDMLSHIECDVAEVVWPAARRFYKPEKPRGRPYRLQLPGSDNVWGGVAYGSVEAAERAAQAYESHVWHRGTIRKRGGLRIIDRRTGEEMKRAPATEAER